MRLQTSRTSLRSNGVRIHNPGAAAAVALSHPLINVAVCCLPEDSTVGVLQL